MIDSNHPFVPSLARELGGQNLEPSDRAVFRSLTTGENIRVAARKRVSAEWLPERILSTFPRLRDCLESRGGRLSGGEQQMLAIGRALAGSPKFLLMDEPTEGLAPILAQEVDRVILELKSQGISILLAEQNLKSALKLADYGSRIEHIREGS